MSTILKQAPGIPDAPLQNTGRSVKSLLNFKSEMGRAHPRCRAEPAWPGRESSSRRCSLRRRRCDRRARKGLATPRRRTPGRPRGGRGRVTPAAIASAFLLLNSDGEVDTAHQLLVAAIEGAARRPERDDEGLIEALYTLSLVCHFGGRAELWDPFHAAVAGLGAALPTVVRLLAHTYADPLSVPAPLLREVDTAVAGLMQGDPDPTRTVRVGVAAFYVDRLAGCREPLRRLSREGNGGRRGPPSARPSCWRGSRCGRAAGVRPRRSSLRESSCAMPRGSGCLRGRADTCRRSWRPAEATTTAAVPSRMR